MMLKVARNMVKYMLMLINQETQYDLNGLVHVDVDQETQFDIN
jgi:hypothetical protein